MPLSGSRLRGSWTSRHPEVGSIVLGVFTPVLAKHSKSFSLVDCLSVGVDRMQRNFEPMRKQVEAWQRAELTDCHCEGRHLRGVCGGQAGSSKTPCAGPCMTCISNRSTRISGRERSGA